MSAAALALALALSACGDDDQPDSAPEATSPATEQTLLRGRFEALVGDVLERRGLDRETIDCALGELAGSISDEEIRAATTEIRETGVPPPTVIEAASAAGEACAAGD